MTRLAGRCPTRLVSDIRLFFGVFLGGWEKLIMIESIIDHRI